MNITRRSRRWLISSGVIVLFLIGGHQAQRMRFEGADAGIASVTGRNLPANVQAKSHAGEINDNLLHTTHYWLVHGPIESLRELAPAPYFVRSDEDAGFKLKSISEAIPLDAEMKMLEGYEGSYDGGRDRWLMILETGDQAIYAW